MYHFYFNFLEVMLIFILIDFQYLQNDALAFKKVRMVKFTFPQIPTAL